MKTDTSANMITAQDSERYRVEETEWKRLQRNNRTGKKRFTISDAWHLGRQKQDRDEGVG